MHNVSMRVRVCTCTYICTITERERERERERKRGRETHTLTSAVNSGILRVSTVVLIVSRIGTVSYIEF